jgi:hypothetical protein
MTVILQYSMYAGKIANCKCIYSCVNVCICSTASSVYFAQKYFLLYKKMAK